MLFDIFAGVVMFFRNLWHLDSPSIVDDGQVFGPKRSLLLK